MSLLIKIFHHQITTCVWLVWWLLTEALALTGLLMDCGKKVKFRGIFRDKIVEKSAIFAGISREFLGTNLAGKQLVKNGGFCGYFEANFARNQSVLR